MASTKDRPLRESIRFALEQNRALFGVSGFLFALDALTYFVGHSAGATLPLVIVWPRPRTMRRGYLRPGMIRSLESARRDESFSVDELMSGFDCFEHAIGVQL